jgi:hypothetical protein
MAFPPGTLVSQTLKIGVTRDNIVVPLDDDRIDKPAPTNDCEQLVALFIRVRAAFRFVRPSFLSGRISILGCQKRPPSLARLRRGTPWMRTPKNFRSPKYSRTVSDQ